MAAKLALLFLACAQVAWTKLPDHYQLMSANGKRDLLWSKITEAPYTPSSLPMDNPSIFSLIGVLNPLFLRDAYTHVDDEMMALRTKTIHSLGTTAKVNFKINPDSPFSGLFAPGNHPALLRASLAFQDGSNFIPGLAVKLFVEGRPSKNFVAMYSLDGQGGNMDFFANDFTTNIPEPSGFAVSALARIFALALRLLDGGAESRPIAETNIPLQELAETNAAGAVFTPFQLRLVPNPAVQTNPNDRTDFRIKLGQIAAGTKLYTVEAARTVDAQYQPIGEIVMESQFVASQYEDEKLYFQHPRMPWRP